MPQATNRLSVQVFFTAVAITAVWASIVSGAIFGLFTVASVTFGKPFWPNFPIAVFGYWVGFGLVFFGSLFFTVPTALAFVAASYPIVRRYGTAHPAVFAVVGSVLGLAVIMIPSMNSARLETVSWWVGTITAGLAGGFGGWKLGDYFRVYVLLSSGRNSDLKKTARRGCLAVRSKV